MSAHNHADRHHHDHGHGHGHDHDHDLSPGAPVPPGYRRVLWIALLVNMAMFFVELLGGVRSGSVSLLADAIDFFGDSASYAVSLAVLSAAPVWRSRTALLKAACMGGFGLFVLGRSAWSAWQGITPDAPTMGGIGVLALIANVSVAGLLYAYRTGDANMRSVWLCSRNDALSNIAVIIAAMGVFGTHTAWPDLAVAVAMGGLAISAAMHVFKASMLEMRQHRQPCP